MNFDDEKKDAVVVTDVISSLLENMHPENAQRIKDGNKVLRSWQAILESIRTTPIDGESPEQMGKNLVSHTRIIDIKNGILLVEADHSAWIQILQIHKKYILANLNKRFPEFSISTIAFRVRGSKAELVDSSKNYSENLRIEREKQARRYEAEEKYLSERGFDVSKEDVPPLPPVLKDLFDKIRADMLTNEGKI